MAKIGSVSTFFLRFVCFFFWLRCVCVFRFFCRRSRFNTFLFVFIYFYPRRRHENRFDQRRRFSSKHIGSKERSMRKIYGLNVAQVMRSGVREFIKTNQTWPSIVGAHPDANPPPAPFALVNVDGRETSSFLIFFFAAHIITRSNW